MGTDIDRNMFHDVSVPGYHKLGLCRTTHVLRVISLHEHLAHAMADPSYLEEVREFFFDAFL